MTVNSFFNPEPPFHYLNFNNNQLSVSQHNDHCLKMQMTLLIISATAIAIITILNFSEPQGTAFKRIISIGKFCQIRFDALFYLSASIFILLQIAALSGRFSQQASLLNELKRLAENAKTYIETYPSNSQ